ncbi:hypothetical protein QMK33_03100 [Hymenobacter sp. H14-R3]|uniref:hypothetical protein n=1 Tax=Hymenobacter sp. H14-R3 TaxID=3046308 RepID=UPI0024BA2E84|nr:hypothetical protein [Hymenobacter sp. H14-R3]MDJ0364125.1 hypothetical protein [Hymenobacter sp. H14-R3]
MPLQTLTKDLAEGHLTPQTLGASLPTSEWELHQPPTGAVYWAFSAPANPGATPAAPDTRLELRRSNQQAQFDVVYKTPRKACVSELRSELRRAKLKAEPVTCLQCEGERFTAPTYTVTIYSQQENFNQGKAPYPFVVVVHSLAGGPPAAN